MLATLYINDEPYQVRDGQNLLHACLSLGFDIPYFCWHPALHAVGACRQCAVKVFRNEADRQGRLVMSCMTPAADGTRLSIDDPEAKAFRAANIEWLMTNHPHDCPVCDEGGECHLQDMTVMAGHTARRFRFPKRTHISQDLGPFVTHEMNRCIQCYRCVRFYRDYAGGRDFNVFASRNAVYFGRHAEGALESPFSGNLVEVCPTGVFTDKTLKRHYTRKWDLQTSPSLCVHCGVGCNTITGEREGLLRRIRNRFNSEVNGYFLCDRGRYGYEFVNGRERIRRPRWRRKDLAAGGATEAPDRKQILQHMTAWAPAGRSAVIGIGSPRASCESNYALRKWVGPERFYSGLGQRDHRLLSMILRILSTGPARTPSLKDVAAADAVLILGEDITNTAPRLALAVRQASRQRPMAVAEKLRIPRWNDAAVREALQDERGPIFIAAPMATGLDDLTAAAFRAAPADLARLGYAAAHILNASSPPVIGLTEAMAAQAEAIARGLRSAEHPLIVSGTALGDEDLIQAAANITWALCASGKGASLCYVTPECNSLGLAMIGGRPLEEAAEAMEREGAGTLVIVENDIFRRADSLWVDRLLNAAGHVVVMDYLENATTAEADVLLPVASWAEGSGTLISNEGRAQRYYRALEPDGEIRESWRWIRDIMAATGNLHTPAWRNLGDVTAEMSRTIPAFQALEKAFPEADFRMAGQRIPRQPHRSSGRTSLSADRSVHEAKPPVDPDSPLAFSMEGFSGDPPSALIPRFWKPGWNSVQSVSKYQEAGGALRGGDPGLRLLDAFMDGKSEFFQTVPSPPSLRRGGEMLAIPIHHIFGSEELSAHAPAIASLSPAPYVALNPADARMYRDLQDQPVGIVLSGREFCLPVRLDPSIPAGMAGIPVGLRGSPGTTLPAPAILFPWHDESEVRP
jgi:NADH-quinone oxidoreductase subunit G